MKKIVWSVLLLMVCGLCLVAMRPAEAAPKAPALDKYTWCQGAFYYKAEGGPFPCVGLEVQIILMDWDSKYLADDLAYSKEDGSYATVVMNVGAETSGIYECLVIDPKGKFGSPLYFGGSWTYGYNNTGVVYMSLNN